MYFELGAETLAKQISHALPGSLKIVSDLQSRPVKSGFRVYVCASHQSFSQHIGQPVGSPVRGIAFLSDVWISPKAFDFQGVDTHASTLTHELSHLHLVQHLGWFRKTKNIPAWFFEGLADWAAGTGDEIVSRRQAINALKGDHHLFPDSTGRLPFPKGASDYGLSWPMLHSQSRLFVEHLYALDKAAFGNFVTALIAGERFGPAFSNYFGQNLTDVWHRFLLSLQEPVTL
ncbi:MAG: hypothetical protein OQJ84_11370 [Xanthomonadales bacterium]|nr:hypothetical protein [Xanthomonadales bacterium]